MSYIPSKGDFITLTFDPQAGHEQKGRRPALVVSNTLFNERTGLAMVCPLTNTDRGYPFHLPVPNTSSLTGFVMVEQLKSVDYRVRQAKFVAVAPTDFLEDVLALIDACIR
ncbi:PemK-like protein [Gloeomargarita lithophora Alchichica-D10]|uniref:PemK-like protein n=1 Tax=Gloeomargarita lithophora Alchichica-D10 TaxID=1188229 RepID=A0A1J0AGP5_9CYAN|nr:type II toxin-antitoxin system PemK/MazF family toxin [Gloeomargarita lithophora]APB35122.1 PemK-like protein [Gloeomargarita lithophora Alchichica-D10]